MQYVSCVCGPTCNWRKAITSAVRELTLSEQCNDVILLRRWGNLFRYSEGSQCLSLQSQSARVDLPFLELLDAKLPEPKPKDTSDTSEFIYLTAHRNIPEDMNLHWHVVFYFGVHLFQSKCIRNIVFLKRYKIFRFWTVTIILHIIITFFPQCYFNVPQVSVCTISITFKTTNWNN